MRALDLTEFIWERHQIYRRKLKGLPKPWTGDSILRSYRFCNVYRELDRETVWIRENWRVPMEQHEDLWFAMVIARLINWSPTLAEMRPPLPWNAQAFVQDLHSRRKAKSKVFGGAYIVSTNGVKMDKAEYLAERVLTPLWVDREHLRPYPTEALSIWHEALMEYQGMGSFIAAQVVADTKFAPRLKKVPDWWTFAASGPGSRRGLNRVLVRPVDQPWNELEWRAALRELQKEVTPIIRKAKMPRISAQDLQNCLCEFDKYERVRLGEGRPRSTYQGV